MLLRLRAWLPRSLGLSILLGGAQATAHPFVDMVPLPPASVSSGSQYAFVLVIFPGDTPVTRVQLDFELSSPLAFGVGPAPEMGDGFTFVRDPEEDPLHFSIEGEFDPPLEAFGAFPVAEITLVAAEPGADLRMHDSSRVEALEFGNPVVYEDFFSAVPPSGVVAHVVPEPSAVPSLAASLVLLAALARARSRR
jgi:hypothetical protein